jgi:DNA-binding CsgD family transcriptional regulator
MLQRLSSWNEADYSRTVEAIYAAPMVQSGWALLLEQFRCIFGLSFASSVRRSADRQHVEGIAAGVPDDDYQDYMRTYFQGSLFGRDPGAARTGLLAPARTMIPHQVFQRTEMYQDYWRPRDMSDALHVGVRLDERQNYHYLSLVRSPHAGPHQDADMALIRPLLPHLRRASELEQRLRQAEFLAATGMRALDLIDNAVLLLDISATLVHANAAAEALLSGDYGLQVKDGQLQAATGMHTARLHKLLAEAARPIGEGAKAGAMRLPNATGGPGLTLLAVPFCRDMHWSLPSLQQILLCVSNPAANLMPAPLLIRDLFGLTEREAWLAAELLSGRTLAQIASGSGRSLNTLRTQMSNVLAKTNVSRQAELMRLFASLPRVTS